MTNIGLYTVKKVGLIYSGLALNFLLAALLLLSTSSAHADGRGWRADRHGGRPSVPPQLGTEPRRF
jgi:hypothetical protein